MKVARRLKQVLQFILGLDNQSIPLHVRLWILLTALKSRVNTLVKGNELAKLSRAGDDVLLRRISGFKTGKEFATHLRHRREPCFFPTLTTQSKEQLTTSLERISPEAREQTLASARQILAHIFNLLGSGPRQVTIPTEPVDGYQPISWHTDFKSGHTWDAETYYRDISYGHIQGVDIKVPWELSRFQHLPTLGKAYYYTSDESLAREFFNEITDWIDGNPPQYGVNWACTMDVAIRVVNWLWGFYFFKESPAISDQFLVRFSKSLYLHGKFIESNLETSPVGINGNHYLSDLVGLIYLGVIFPEFKESRKWRDSAIKELIKEIGKQVCTDGVDYEGSISYHRLVTELYLLVTLLGLRNGISFPAWYMKRLEKMLEFVMFYTKPDGAAPQIGDNDDGRLYILADYSKWDRLDHRYLLSTGAVLFNRPDFKQASGRFHEEAYWLLGEEGLQAFDRLPSSERQISSMDYTEGGFYIMRHKDLYMMVDCIPADTKAPSGHMHNSRLSFELFADDKSFIIDPGAYIYTPDPPMRNLFRSTSYHNTVVVDNEEQNRFEKDELFNMRHDTVVEINRWQATGDYDILDAQHRGYNRLYNPIIHRRQIYFNKVEGYWIIRDILSGKYNHRFDLYFHLAPLELELDNDSPLVVRTKTQGTNLAIIPAETEGIRLEILKGWISYRYGVKAEAPVVRYSRNGQGLTIFCTILYPYQTAINIQEIINTGRETLENSLGGVQ